MAGRNCRGFGNPRTACERRHIRFSSWRRTRPRALARSAKIIGRKSMAQAIDPSRAYRQTLPSGKTIGLFFYDRPIARAVAFEGLLTHGEQFVGKLLGGFAADRVPGRNSCTSPPTARAMAITIGSATWRSPTPSNRSKPNNWRGLTNYGEFLEKHPPTHEVEIVEKTSWSCAHGIDRWWSDCGCNSGGHPGWSQAWRTPLRDALDRLRDAVAPPCGRASRRAISRILGSPAMLISK